MLRVFLVEDESAVRETLRDTIPWARCGYTFAGEAADGEMALPLIRQVRPDVLIADVRMPCMDGLTLSRLVSREFPEMKIVIVSAHDDFAYAQEAIDIGVERYLLKPVDRDALLDVLAKIRDKLQRERAGRDCPDPFPRESQEHERYARRTFFERIAAGELSVRQICETAAELNIDLRARCYCLAFFSALPERIVSRKGRPAPDARLRDALLEPFLKYPEYVLARWSLSTYAVLIKGDDPHIEELSRRCVDTVRDRYEAYAPEWDWYVAVSRPTQRLSTLSACFEEVSRLWAYRYILPRQHLLTADTVGSLTGAGADPGLDRLDAEKADPAIFTAAMRSAGAQEIPSFVDEYLRSVEAALPYKPFCQYLMLAVRFAAARFAATLGIGQQELFAPLTCLDMAGRSVTAEELRSYLTAVLLRTLELRDRASGGQCRGLLQQAVRYIDRHFTDASLSLDRVAREVNLSANYLSAVFRQETGSTFTAYVTGKRMERAKELLRTTDKRSGEIAAAVGYRDPHYFSFLFRKTQGCTPRDYRGRRP